jgi:hypothetical protein
MSATQQMGVFQQSATKSKGLANNQPFAFCSYFYLCAGCAR